MPSQHRHRRYSRYFIVIAAIALILTALAPVNASVARAQAPAVQAETHAHTHTHQGGEARSDPDRGLVYSGLKKSTSGRCAGAYEVGNTGLCTHGPDAPPKGYDVKRDVAPIPNTPERAAPGAEPKPSTAGLTVCEGDHVSGDRTQVLYVRALDVADRYSTFLTSFRRWAADADRIYSRSAVKSGGTRRIRFRTTLVNGVCEIDVFNVVVSATGDDNFDNTINEVKNQGHKFTNRKYMMFVDANVYCGLGTIWNDSQSGQGNLNNTGPSYGRTDSGCWGGFIAAHEHNHNLGGVQRNAPHTSFYPGTPDGWHCTDDYDVMCYDDDGTGPITTQPVCNDHSRDENLFDCNNDDYYHTNPPPGSYLATNWNVANNKFLINEGSCPDSFHEGDDDQSHARLLNFPNPPDAPRVTEQHAFCSPDDEDWIKVNAIAGNIYRFETLNLQGGADTILELYAPNGFTLIAANDDGGSGSLIDYTPTTSGTYYLKVKSSRGKSHPTQTYDLRVNLFDFPPQTSITSGPSQYTRDTTPTFTWSGTDNSTPDANLTYSRIVDPSPLSQWSPYTSAKSVTLPPLSQGVHSFSVVARDQAGNIDPTPAGRSFRVDSVAPAAKAPVHNLATNSTVGTTVPVTISWAGATDTNGSGIARYVLHQSNNGGSTWTNIPLPASPITSIVRNLTPGATSYRYRVQAIDRAGNVSALVTGSTFTVNVLQDAPSAIVTYPAGAWTTSSNAAFFGGTVRYAKGAGAIARLSIPAGTESVAWMAIKNTNRGKADVYVDNVKVTATPIDMYRSSLLTKQLTFTRALNPATTHTLEVRVLGAKNTSATDTIVDIDAFITLR